MKTNPRHGRAAFTLIELMAVITIIVILAGLVVGGMGFVSERQAKEKAKVQTQLLAKAIEEYKLDIGMYPPTSDKNSASAPNGTSTSADLYVCLFYEGYDYAEKSKGGSAPTSWTKTVGGVSVPKATKIYLPELDPTTTKQGWVDTVTGASAKPPTSTPIRDPWGNQYCYRSATDASGKSNTNSQNPDFDLWSMGKDGKTNASNPSLTSPATNNPNKDDIRNF